MSLLLFSVLFTIAASAQPISMQDLVGKWDAVDESGAHGTLEIIDSTTLFLTFRDQKKPIVSYTADFTRSPKWFDFAVKEETDIVHLKSILRVISPNKLHWQFFSGPKHPQYFSTDKGDMVYLLKRK